VWAVEGGGRRAKADDDSVKARSGTDGHHLGESPCPILLEHFQALLAISCSPLLVPVKSQVNRPRGSPIVHSVTRHVRHETISITHRVLLEGGAARPLPPETAIPARMASPRDIFSTHDALASASLFQLDLPLFLHLVCCAQPHHHRRGAYEGGATDGPRA